MLLFAALNKGLISNFAEVKAEVVDSPDLTLKPFSLASKGNYKLMKSTMFEMKLNLK